MGALVAAEVALVTATELVGPTDPDDALVAFAVVNVNRVVE
jgi:hypothetical protein